MIITRAIPFAIATVFALALTATAAVTPADAHKRHYSHKHQNGVVVKAPGTRVKTRRGRTTVHAPHTGVDVDRRRREVRIDVPYFNGTIRY